MTMMNKWLLGYRAFLAPDGPSGGGTPSAPSSGTSGGGAAPSAPSASPSGASPSTSAPSPSQTASDGSSPDQGGDAPPDNFEMFFRDDGSPPPGMESGEAPPVQPVQAQAPAAPLPQEAAPPSATPVATPAQESAAPAAGQSQPGAQSAPALDPYDPVSLGQHLANNEEAATQFVAENMFKLSPEEVEAIETDVIGTIPKLLGKVFVKSQANVLAQLGRMIPTMIQRHTEAMIRNKEGEDKFYQRWPELNSAQHGKLATQYAVAYRGMHPNATMDQMIEAIGPYVMMAAGVAPGSMGVAGQQPRQGAAAPRTPTNGRQPPPAPFVPAGASGGPASHSTTPQMEPWEAIFMPPGG